MQDPCELGLSFPPVYWLRFMGLRAPPNWGEGQGLYVRVMLAADGSLCFPSSWPVPNTSSQGAMFWNLGAIDAQSTLACHF